MTIKAKLGMAWALTAVGLAAAAGLAAAPALADVKAGVDAWSRGDYAKAIAEWKGPADRGDGDAMFNMGQAYKLGRGVPVDLAKAEDLFSKAAAKGHLQAADNYGLLLFQRGEQARAMPYVKAAADRGDPRSQYLLGLAHFNGDNVAKDWVRAYALVSLAQQAGLAQAAPALAQMDKYIPLDQRQQSVSLASQLAGDAVATRERQLTAVDLGTNVPSVPTPARAAATVAGVNAPSVPASVRTAAAVAGVKAPAAPAPVRTAAAATGLAPKPTPVSPEAAVAMAERIAAGEAPRTAGADFTRPQTPAPVAAPVAAPATTRPAAPAPAAAATPAPARVAAAQPKPETPASAPAASTGAWRVQLGAFGVPGNAEALWNRVKTRPELAGHAKLLVPAGKVAKLQAGGFTSQSDAQSACSRLSAAGFACLPVRN